jgi:hypothetical protein
VVGVAALPSHARWFCNGNRIRFLLLLRLQQASVLQLLLLRRGRPLRRSWSLAAAERQGLLSRRVVQAMRAPKERHCLLHGMVTWIGLRQTAVVYDRAACSAGETHYPMSKMKDA